MIVLNNLNLFIGDADETIENGSLVIDQDKILYAGDSANKPDISSDINEIDCMGLFAMPGMTESHAHLSYTNNGPLELDKSPVEEVMIKTINNARVMLGSGFTSAISFGSVHRIDAFLKQGIENNDIIGPRLLAGGRDIGSTGSNADLHPDYARTAPGRFEKL